MHLPKDPHMQNFIWSIGGWVTATPLSKNLDFDVPLLLFCRQSYWLFLEIFNLLKIRKSKILNILTTIFMSLHQSEVGSGDISAACVLCCYCRLIGKIIQSCFIDISTSISVWSCDWRYVCNCWLTWQHYHLNIRLTCQKYCPLKG